MPWVWVIERKRAFACAILSRSLRFLYLYCFDCQFCGSLHMMEIVVILSSLAYGHATLDHLLSFIVHACMTICNRSKKMNLLKEPHTCRVLCPPSSISCSCLSSSWLRYCCHLFSSSWRGEVRVLLEYEWIRLHIQLETRRNDYHIFPPSSRCIRYNKQPSAL